MTLHLVPQEILEQIAFFLATEEICGPPSSLVSLLLTNRKVNTRLSTKNNPHLYATIFTYKFDVRIAKRRLGDETTSSELLCAELQRRFTLLKRIRTRDDCHIQETSPELRDILITAYLMMLENEGNNRLQLSYAGITKWIEGYLFGKNGASLAVQSLQAGSYPPSTRENTLAMWLFWFFMRPRDYSGRSDGPESPQRIVKAVALSAHLYDLTNLTWVEHSPTPPTEPTMTVTWYTKFLDLTPPPLAIPAILSFMAFVNPRKALPITPSDPSILAEPSDEWRAEWGRAILSGKAPTEISDCFVLGSFEGIWEGFFTYTEFTAYAAMLRGAAPQVIQKSIVGSHQQTWKLREWHLVEGVADSDDLYRGDPLRSYFPIGARISETSDGLTLTLPGRALPIAYQRAGTRPGKVVDVIITGEGHSAWGQFNLTGRVRPCDGFISLSKDYLNDDRGKWLYRGYLVGNRHGNFVGRWRDTMSSVFHQGYEGCFAMSRRR